MTPFLLEQSLELADLGVTQFQILIGSILGDGGIKRYRSGRYYFHGMNGLAPKRPRPLAKITFA
jgi:hypothetical protein